MLIINDFFKRYNEAVSNQMEAALNALGGKIVTATRFLGQQALQEEDKRDNIFVYEPEQFDEIMAREVLFGDQDQILVYEEEPCQFKRDVFNKSGKDVFVAMYRKPYAEYIDHLKGYKNLKKVFVELESHRQILISSGFEEDKVIVTPTPAKIKRGKSKKCYDPNNINLVFASWNNTDEMDTTQIRGLNYIVDCIEKYPNMNLSVVLRDNRTQKFWNYVKSKGVQDKVELINICSDDDLLKIFDDSDFVIYFLQFQIVKDVPNSLIDGISRGKPILMTNVLSFSDDVTKNNIGKVFKPKDKVRNFAVEKSEYEQLSENAYNYSYNHTIENYMKVLQENCGGCHELGDNNTLGN